MLMEGKKTAEWVDIKVLCNLEVSGIVKLSEAAIQRCS